MIFRTTMFQSVCLSGLFLIIINLSVSLGDDLFCYVCDDCRLQKLVRVQLCRKPLEYLKPTSSEKQPSTVTESLAIPKPTYVDATTVRYTIKTSEATRSTTKNIAPAVIITTSYFSSLQTKSVPITNLTSSTSSLKSTRAEVITNKVIQATPTKTDRITHKTTVSRTKPTRETIVTETASATTTTTTEDAPTTPTTKITTSEYAFTTPTPNTTATEYASSTTTTSATTSQDALTEPTTTTPTSSTFHTTNFTIDEETTTNPTTFLSNVSIIINATFENYYNTMATPTSNIIEDNITTSSFSFTIENDTFTNATEGTTFKDDNTTATTSSNTIQYVNILQTLAANIIDDFNSFSTAISTDNTEYFNITASLSSNFIDDSNITKAKEISNYTTDIPRNTSDIYSSDLEPVTVITRNRSLQRARIRRHYTPAFEVVAIPPFKNVSHRRRANKLTMAPLDFVIIPLNMLSKLHAHENITETRPKYIQPKDAIVKELLPGPEFACYTITLRGKIQKGCVEFDQQMSPCKLLNAKYRPSTCEICFVSQCNSTDPSLLEPLKMFLLKLFYIYLLFLVL